MYSVSVHTSGPLFDGRAEKAAQDSLEPITRAVAVRGVVLVRSILAEVLKHPTGYYQSNISYTGDNPATISDNRVVYGPWLEGVGSRNSPVTRFPGYHTFRKATPALDRVALNTANQVIQRFIARMN